jgi:hypothetical protein
VNSATDWVDVAGRLLPVAVGIFLVLSGALRALSVEPLKSVIDRRFTTTRTDGFN